MTKWDYGGAFERFPVTEEPYVFKDGSIIQVHDIMKPLPEFMKKADVIFTDSPWNLGNLTTFYTKADKAKEIGRFEHFYIRLFECVEEIHPAICFLEIGKQHLADYITKMRKLYKHVTFYNSMYYHNKKNKCYVVEGSNKRVPLKLDDIDEEDIIKKICYELDYEYIGDLCMGRGLVGEHAYGANKKFVGTELNHKRLSVLREKIEG